MFASNFVGMWAAPIQASDVVGGPYAAVAARALLTDEPVRQQIPLTGPQALSNSDLIEVIGAVLGRPLRYFEVSPDVVRQRFIDLGLGAEFADAYMAMLAESVDTPALVTREVEKITGRPATTFAQWVYDHRDLFTKHSRRQAMSDPRPPRYLKPMNKVMMAAQRLGIPTGPAIWC